MPSITVDDVTYTFSGHALGRMKRYHFSLSMVEAVMLDPDRYEPSLSSSHMLYVKQLSGSRYPLQVVVDEADQKIVSVHWLKPS